MVIASTAPINPDEAYNLIAKKRSGSVVLHYAVVKEDTGTGTVTSCIDYRADGDVKEELETIAAELQHRWDLEDVLLIRRIACLGVGEIISLVATRPPTKASQRVSCWT